MRRFVQIGLGVLALVFIGEPALARDRHRDWDDDGYHQGHHRHRYHHHGYGQHYFFGSFFVPPRPVVERTYIVSNQYYTPQPVAYTPAPQGYCREYNGPINVGGRVQHGYGTACLQPDGSWQIID